MTENPNMPMPNPGGKRLIPSLDPLVPMILVAAGVGFISSCAAELFRAAMYAIVRLYSGQEHLVAAARAMPLPLRVAVLALGGLGCGRRSVYADALGLAAGMHAAPVPRDQAFFCQSSMPEEHSNQSSKNSC